MKNIHHICILDGGAFVAILRPFGLENRARVLSSLAQHLAYGPGGEGCVGFGVLEPGYRSQLCCIAVIWSGLSSSPLSVSASSPGK